MQSLRNGLRFSFAWGRQIGRAQDSVFRGLNPTFNVPGGIGMWPATLLIVYCLLIVLASLLGGWLPSLVRLTHTRMQVMMSFVSGLMLGVALLHLLPHAVGILPSIGWAVGGTLTGLLVMFFMIRIFQFHQHGPAEEDGHDHGHDHGDGHGDEQHGSRFGWTGLAMGLALHTMIDGVSLGAAVRVESQGNAALSLFGLGIFLAVALHKPLDALSITSLMAANGWSATRRQWVNAGFAMMCPLGAGLFWFSWLQSGPQQDMLLGCALAFSAGVFLCISLGDLLPEVHFHTHDRFKLSAALLMGVSLALAIEMLPGHTHPHGAPQQEQIQDLDRDQIEPDQ